jgi:CheY-like chemotaxis protein
METSPPTILIIEDSAFIRAAARDALVEAGYRVYEEANGKEGLARALRTHPDLIMLDLMMPVMDGMTMFKLLRKDEWGAHVPVIILTGTKDETLEGEHPEEKLDFLLKENWVVDQVVERVKLRLREAAK